MRKKYMGIIVLFLWASIIFAFSNADAISSSKATNFIIDIFKDLAKDNVFLSFILSKLTEKHSLVYSIRKLAHIFVFCVLQLIVFWILKINKISTLKSTILSILVVFAYACIDEFHQYFVPGRSAELKDVFIDTLGGFVGLIISYLILLFKLMVVYCFKRKVKE